MVSSHENISRPKFLVRYDLELAEAMLYEEALHATIKELARTFTVGWPLFSKLRGETGRAKLFVDEVVDVTDPDFAYKAALAIDFEACELSLYLRNPDFIPTPLQLRFLATFYELEDLKTGTNLLRPFKKPTMRMQTTCLLFQTLSP